MFWVIGAFWGVLIYLWAHPQWFAPRNWGALDDENNAEYFTPYNHEKESV